MQGEKLTPSKIQQRINKIPRLKNCILLSKHYKNVKKLLKWKYVDKKGNVQFSETSLRDLRKHHFHFAEENKHWTTWMIKKTIPYLPNSKGYTLLDNRKSSVRDDLCWRYIDSRNKVHYFLLSWLNFYKKGKRFKNIYLKNKDIVQEIYNAVGDRFNVLSVSWNGTKVHAGREYYVLIRHNCKRCNYSSHWMELHNLIRRKGACPKCKAIIWGDTNRNSKKKVLKSVYSQYDNRDHKYVPNMSTFYTISQQLTWAEFHKDGTISTFSSSIDNFLKGRRPDNRFKNEKFFNYLLNEYTNMRKNIDYFHGYSPRGHDDTNTYNGRFDFYFPNIDNNKIAVEMNGLQHKKPVNWGKMSKEKQLKRFKNQQKRDKNKEIFCNKNNITLIWIPCYYFSTRSHKLSAHSFRHVKKVIRTHFVNKVLPIL